MRLHFVLSSIPHWTHPAYDITKTTFHREDQINPSVERATYNSHIIFNKKGQTTDRLLSIYTALKNRHPYFCNYSVFWPILKIFGLATLQQWKFATKHTFQIWYWCVVFNCNPSRKHAKYGQCWRNNNAAKSNAKVSHSIRNEHNTVKDDQIRSSKSRPLAFTQTHQWIIKFTADAGKRCSSFRARVRCNAHFARVSSCAHFFKHFNFKFRRTIRYTEEWWIPVSREIWRVVLSLFGASSWLKINSLTESTFSSVCG